MLRFLGTRGNIGQENYDFRKEKPDFLIAGAARSGDTAMHHYLKQRPEIYVPDNKVPQFPGAVSWTRCCVQLSGRKGISNVDKLEPTSSLGCLARPGF